MLDVIRGEPRAGDAFRELIERDETIQASEISRIELLAGARPHQDVPLRRLFDILEWIPLDRAVAELAGGLARRFSSTHPGIDIPDYAIAATATVNEADLWTLNLRHFPMFEGLERPY